MTLLTLIIVGALLLLAPTDCGCRVDLHHGEPLHPVFAHFHPAASTEPEVTAAKDGQPRLFGAAPAESVGLLLIAGQSLPGLVDDLFPPPTRQLHWSGRIQPAGVTSPPPDPPPKMV